MSYISTSVHIHTHTHTQSHPNVDLDVAPNRKLMETFTGFLPWNEQQTSLQQDVEVNPKQTKDYDYISHGSVSREPK